MVIYAIASSPAASLPEFVPEKPSSCIDNHMLPIGTPVAFFLYEMPIGSQFVPQGMLSCTDRVYAPRWYTSDLFPVPNVS